MTDINSLTITKVIDAFTVNSPKGRKTVMQNRPSYGLSFCQSGQITYTHRGKSYISDADHAVILPKAQTYTLTGDKSGIFPVINFDCIGMPYDTIAIYRIKNPDVFIKYFNQLRRLMIFKDNRTKVMGIFYDILYNIKIQNLSFSPKLTDAMLYIEKNISNPKLTNSEIAAHCNISEVYFRKLFSEHYKSSPRRYILDTRITAAKQMLSEGIFKVSAVADECGFLSLYHFSRIFKSKTGLTPTEYMDKYKKTDI